MEQIKKERSLKASRSEGRSKGNYFKICTTFNLLIKLTVKTIAKKT